MKISEEYHETISALFCAFNNNIDVQTKAYEYRNNNRFTRLLLHKKHMESIKKCIGSNWISSSVKATVLRYDTELSRANSDSWGLFP